jgi:hypothetical protein
MWSNRSQDRFGADFIEILSVNRLQRNLSIDINPPLFTLACQYLVRKCVCKFGVQQYN